MSFIRPLLAVLVTVVLTAGLGAATMAPANAARADHDVRSVKAGEIRNSGKFFTKGRITTTKRVYLQRKARRGAPYRTIKFDKTNQRGKFRIKFDGPRGSCYRIVAKKTPRYKVYQQKIGCIRAA